jgi:hypothetical protein
VRVVRRGGLKAIAGLERYCVERGLQAIGQIAASGS